MEITRETQVRIPSQVLYRELGDETVLLDPHSGVYYGLDAVGTRLWTLLTETPRVAAVYDRLMEEFEVAPDRLWQDLTGFLAELEEKGLIHVEAE